MDDRDRLELSRLRDRIGHRVASGDADPEAGHSDIDGIAEDVLREIAAGHPDAKEMAALVIELLDHEDREHWRRWYA